MSLGIVGGRGLRRSKVTFNEKDARSPTYSNTENNHDDDDDARRPTYSNTENIHDDDDDGNGDDDDDDDDDDYSDL